MRRRYEILKDDLAESSIVLTHVTLYFWGEGALVCSTFLNTLCRRIFLSLRDLGLSRRWGS